MRSITACALLVLTFFLQPVGSDAAEPGVHTVSADGIACREFEEFDRIVGMLVAGDKKAFTKAATEAIVAGRCTILKQGMTVYLEDVKMFRGVVKVRPQGLTVAYWINTEKVH